MNDIDRARDLDRRLNASRDPEEMKALISARRLLRAGMQFEYALAALEPARTAPTVRHPFPNR